MNDELDNDALTDQPSAAEPATHGHAALGPRLIVRLIAPPTQPMDAREIPAAAAPLGPPPRPWGLWATIGWCALGAFLEVIVSIVLILIFGIASAMRDPTTTVSGEALEKLFESGFFLSISTIVMTPIGLAYLVLVVRWRRWRIRDYLALKQPALGQTLRWLAVIAVYVAIMDAVALILGRDVVNPFMAEAYKTAGSICLLVITLVIVAPLFEETVFRGFMFRGIASSRAGVVSAIVITSILWSLMHTQYGWLEISMIVGGGLLLGWARHQSGSTLLPMLMHAFMNVVATVETVIKLELMS